MVALSLQNDGDDFEKHYWDRFISSEFPAYERFWIRSVAPLTNRPIDIHLKTPDQLKAERRSDNDVCIGQLHYSILRHLARAFDLKSISSLNLDQLTEGMVRIIGAQDVAFELLERFHSSTAYDPWLAVGQSGKKGSREARSAWQKKESHPLQSIRDYRNHLVHGRLMPGVVGQKLYVPRIGKEQNYFDWRTITQGSTWQSQLDDQLIPAKDVLADAWQQTVSYLQNAWGTHLLSSES